MGRNFKSGAVVLVRTEYLSVLVSDLSMYYLMYVSDWKYI